MYGTQCLMEVSTDSVVTVVRVSPDKSLCMFIRVIIQVQYGHPSYLTRPTPPHTIFWKLTVSKP